LYLLAVASLRRLLAVASLCRLLAACSLPLAYTSLLAAGIKPYHLKPSKKLFYSYAPNHHLPSK
jgi:hypothetical protein